jgi:hypothetical protein
MKSCSGLIVSLAISTASVFFMNLACATKAGQVIYAKGQLVAIDAAGQQRVLKRRSIFNEGDTLKTGSNSHAQVRFIDKALLSLTPDSELKVATYQQSGSDNDAPGRAVLNLVKGGFRTITGSIGKDNANAYKVETPAASIGIRGTDYQVMQESQDAFVVGVYEGGVRVENEVGALDLGFSANFSYSRVTPLTAPQGLVKPPSIFMLKPVSIAEEEASDTESESDASDDESVSDMNTFNASESEPFDSSISSVEGEQLDFETKIIVQGQLLNESLDDFQEDLEQTIAEVIEQSQELEEMNSSDSNWVNFDDIYGGVPTSANANTFANVGLHQKEWDLYQAKNIEALVVPAVLEEVSFTSPGALAPSDFTGTALTFTISYQARGESVVTDTINLNQNITQVSEYADFLNSTFKESNIPLVASVNEMYSGKFLHVEAIETDSLFVEALTLSSFSGDATGITNFGQLDNLDGINLTPAYSDEVALGFGSFDANKTFVYFENEVDDVLGTEFQTLARRSLPKSICSLSAGVVSNCDIQVLKVSGRENITWGVWALDSANPVDVTNNQTGTLSTRTESNGYVYWAAAEPAEVNQLTGTLTFKGTLDCTNLGACMGSGVIDDTITSGTDLAYNVSDVDVSINANFTANTIASGKLVVTGVSDFAQSTETIEIGWDVSFSGNIKNSGFEASNFTASQITGPSGSDFPCVNCVEGEINGLFVAPGDKAVGGFQLRKKNGSSLEVHTGGFFVADKM